MAAILHFNGYDEEKVMNQSELNILLSSKEFRFRRVFWNDYLISVDSNTLLKQYGLEQAGNDYSIVSLKTDFSVAYMINRISGKNRMLTYAIFLSLVEYLLHRYTGEKQVVVFIPEQNSKYGFNRCLPLLTEIRGEMAYREYLSEVKNRLAEVIKNQEYPIEQVLEHLDEGKDGKVENLSNVTCTIGEPECNYESDFVFDLSEKEYSFVLTLKYRNDRADKLFAEVALRHIEVLIKECLSNSGIPLKDVDYLTAEEKTFWNEQYNKPYGNVGETVIALFEKRACDNPDSVALVSGEEELYYGELNKRANALAHRIMEESIKKGYVIGIIMDTTTEVVISMLASLKVGAIYLPINDTYPLQRIEYMLEMGNVSLILGLGKTSIPGYKYIDVTDESIYTSGKCTNPDVAVTSDDCAYMIFTSGSTGKPKGAVIRHKGLSNYIIWAAKVYAGNKECCVPLYSSISFDLTVTSIYMPLIIGGKVIVYGGFDKGALIRTILSDNRVNIMKLTPAHMLILDEIDCSDSMIEKFIVGGDNLNVDIVERITAKFGRKVDFYNEYGPTEATVGCMIHRYDKEIDRAGSVSIGIPADNTRIFLLDEYNKCVPYGVSGEMYLAGFGLAKEYYNNPEATAGSFIEENDLDSGKIYKTGDYAFMKSTGEMEFLGRRDNQIKLKGYRIGLGEIENSLFASENVVSCVVRCVETEPGQKQLCAFLTVIRDKNASDFREFLKATLPDYMIPAHFYRVDAIPVNQNGKVDVDSLLLQMVDLDVKEEYVAPTTPVEKMLVSIYEEILGKENISILDDFFALGGDSIKAIRVAAKLYKINFQVGIEEIFMYPQIQSLSKHLQKFEADVEDLSGEIMLSPIQKYFFERKLNNPDGYFQSMVFKINDNVSPAMLTEVWDKLVVMHDAFRMRFENKDGEVRCFYSKDGNNYYHEELCLDENELIKNITVFGKLLSEMMNIERGPLVAWDYIKTENGNYMFVMIHHLIIDGVSWRVILDDMDMLFSDINAEDPGKTSSYMAWSKWINSYGNEDSRQYELEYWNGVLQKAESVFEVTEETANRQLQTVIELDEEETSHLSEDVHKAFNTDVTGFLLTAFSKAVSDTCGKNIIPVMVESHGREILGDTLNVSRTVGWFTSIYPVILNVDSGEGIDSLLKGVKKSMEEIPHKGFDYSILKYCRKDIGYCRAIFDKQFQILFNYLGDISTDVEKNNFRQVAFGFSGNTASEEKHEYALEINGVTLNGRMQFKATYGEGSLTDRVVADIMKRFKDNLESYTEYCMDICNAGTGNKLNADSDISVDDMQSIEAMLGQIGIE